MSEVAKPVIVRVNGEELWGSFPSKSTADLLAKQIDGLRVLPFGVKVKNLNHITKEVLEWEEVKGHWSVWKIS